MPSNPDVDAYIAKFPQEVREKLQSLRAHILALAGDVEEKMAYGIPTYKKGKNIFHFAAYQGHIGLYPGPAAIQAHPKELAAFKTSKGAVQVPLAQPVPLELVTRLVQFNLSAPVAKKPRSDRKGKDTK